MLERKTNPIKHANSYLETNKFFRQKDINFTFAICKGNSIGYG